jgi:hypothetical protein
VRRSAFDLAAAAGPFWPGEFREELGIRSPRTLDRYLKMPGFPSGRIERCGRVEVRVFDLADVARAEAWLREHNLPGRRAGQMRVENLQRARSARAGVTDLVQLAGRLLRRGGAEALVEALRPIGCAGIGFERVEERRRVAVRAALARAIEMH